LINRIFVEKKRPYAVEAASLLADLKTNLKIDKIQELKVVNRYDFCGFVDKNDPAFLTALSTIFSEPPLDYLYREEYPLVSGETAFAIEYLPGQFDQRADSAAQCLRILKPDSQPIVQAAKLIILSGNLTKEDIEKIKAYCINPVDSREAALTKPQTLTLPYTPPNPVSVLEGFIERNDQELAALYANLELAMSLADLHFCRNYFRDTEKRDPTITEIRVIDTYWSDHCRHTTFLTKINRITFEDSHFNRAVNESFKKYLEFREYVYKDKEAKDLCLMDLATIAAKEMKKMGVLDDLDESEEINACSIKATITVEKDGLETKEPWLIMFKNETHNHPTEIEPFGGAATCLGGAIRDPLSGRSYVYQAMRLSGSGDPRANISDTLSGKLPQRKIAKESAHGYSSYGNQIGLATGQVTEVYDEGFIAKHMEVGAVIGAAPTANVIRKKPRTGDLVILLGGRTGRDGCGGATGSSKEHTVTSLENCSAEVQKGNPLTERKLQRLFANSKAAKMIKRCNDFGAGGVSVAIGELTDGLEIDLNRIPKKYEGLDGTELAISESQERMAIVVDADDAESFIQMAAEENLEATVVATVTDKKRLVMNWQNQTIVDIARDFLNTNGVRQETDVHVQAADMDKNYFLSSPEFVDTMSTHDAWLYNLTLLNHACQKGLVEQFDSTIGAATVLMPYGGKYQLTPALGMAAKLPVQGGVSKDATLMAYGYHSALANWSPYHGAIYAVVESVVKIVAMGGSPNGIYLTLQEYFEKLGDDANKWGKPFAALLGAFEAQIGLDAPAIGGKDSMSGTFQDLTVPPTLISFAVQTVMDSNMILSPEFKAADNHVILIPLVCDKYEVPNFDELKQSLRKVHELTLQNKILSAQTIDTGGIAGAISKMTFGNQIGVEIEGTWDNDIIFAPEIASIIVEMTGEIDIEDVADLFEETDFEYLGMTIKDPVIRINNEEIKIEDAIHAWTQPLEGVFATKVNNPDISAIPPVTNKQPVKTTVESKRLKPKVIIPVFPGTNCEYDTAKAFTAAGGDVETFVFRNITDNDIKDSIEVLAKAIRNCQILALPGGFSAGDEPDGSGKFIASIFKNPLIKDAIASHLEENEGLILGICNGFQALLKMGLLPYGQIRDLTPTSPTLTYNTIGRHSSKIAKTKVVSKLSPWFSQCSTDDIYNIAISHGEGRFVATQEELDALAASGQIATQYVDDAGQPSMDIGHNPNGALYAIEGITSQDGRILGKMGHSERIIIPGIAKNIPGTKIQPIFASGIAYFK